MDLDNDVEDIVNNFVFDCREKVWNLEFVSTVLLYCLCLFDLVWFSYQIFHHGSECELLIQTDCRHGLGAFYTNLPDEEKHARARLGDAKGHMSPTRTLTLLKIRFRGGKG